jgi:hypothetical protein
MIDKTYLEKAPITGYSRISLQHPVKGGCNPIHPTCSADFKSRGELNYCSKDGAPKDGLGEHAVNCTYFDQFTLNEFATGMSGETFLIPTRISTYIQQVDVQCVEQPDCAHLYKVLKESHEFVADIEDYTLLIDHSSASDELDRHGDSWSTPGFYRICSNETDCPTLMIPCSNNTCDEAFSSFSEQAVIDGYDASGVVQDGAYSRSNGDVFKVRDILRMADVDLDRLEGDSADSKGAVRYEGEAVVLEVHYLNFKKWHRPNSLPVIYEYVARRMPAETYKTTRMWPIGSDGTKRQVIDVHGILLTVKVIGTLGKFDLFNMMTMFLEVVAILGLLNWILSCMALNWTTDRTGDEFFAKVYEAYNLGNEHDLNANSEQARDDPDARSEEIWPLNRSSHVES